MLYYSASLHVKAMLFWRKANTAHNILFISIIETSFFESSGAIEKVMGSSIPCAKNIHLQLSNPK